MGLFGGLGKVLHDTVKGVGSFIPGIGDAEAAEDANLANKASANTQMKFQERMSNSAYQRTMDDMEKAGLNPMLAYSQGGASTPSGAASTAQPASKTGLAQFAMQAATGLNTAKNQATLTGNTLQDSEQSRKLQGTQSAKNAADTEQTLLKNQILKKDIPFAKLKGDLAGGATKIMREIGEKFGNSARDIQKTMSKPTPDDQKRMDYMMDATKNIRKQK